MTSRGIASAKAKSQQKGKKRKVIDESTSQLPKLKRTKAHNDNGNADSAGSGSKTTAAETSQTRKSHQVTVMTEEEYEASLGPDVVMEEPVEVSSGEESEKESSEAELGKYEIVFKVLSS
jgi:hypothetical protein